MALGGCGRLSDTPGPSGAAAVPALAPVAAGHDPGPSPSPATAPPPRRETPAAPPPGTLAVMIDNHPDARPQQGLEQADIVFEAMAEGGITRFLALYSSRGAHRVGPVRSVRPYFAALARGYDAPLAHAGGSEEALRAMEAWRVADLDEIHRAGEAYWRSSGRRAPHNLYTSTDLLARAARRRGFPPRPLEPLRSGPLPPGGTPAAGVTLRYSQGRYPYETGYRWNGQAYEKFVNGVPFAGAKGTLQVPSLAVLIAPTRATGDQQGHMEIGIPGQGTALYFRAGQVFEGRWRKASAAAPLELLYQGEAMPLAPGPLWVQIIGSRNLIDLDPGAAGGPPGAPAQPTPPAG